jgi:hypothetical protein
MTEAKSQHQPNYTDPRAVDAEFFPIPSLHTEIPQRIRTISVSDLAENHRYHTIALSSELLNIVRMAKKLRQNQYTRISFYTQPPATQTPPHPTQNDR